MTYEEVKEIRQHPRMAHIDNNELHKMIDDAVDKQIAKKPLGGTDIDGNQYLICPECSQIVAADIIDYKVNYCPDCGQKIDWSVEE